MRFLFNVTAVLLIVAGMGCAKVGSAPKLSQLAAASNDFFTYTVDTVPRSALTCGQEAAALGERFAKATGITPFKSDCAGETSDGYELTVTYVAPRKLQIVAARYDLFGNDPNAPNDPPLPNLEGLFSTFADCAANIPVKIAEFEQQTKLKSVSAYCYTSMLGTTYGMRVDGFGQPAKQFFQFHGEFKGTIDESFLGSQSMLISKNGGKVSALAARGPHAFVMYYASKSLDPKPVTIGLYDALQTSKQCVTELAEAARIIKETSSEAPALARCLVSQETALFYLNFAFAINQQVTPYWQRYGPKYGTYEGCVADRQRIVDQVRQSTGIDARGTICELENENSNQFQSVVLGK